MYFSLPTLATVLAASATFAAAVPLSPASGLNMKRDYDNELYVVLGGCGSCGAVSGELSFVFLGNGVAPYSLATIDATTGAVIEQVDTNITQTRYSWITDGYTPAGTTFKLALTDSTGATVNSTEATMGQHPGRV